jgi:hypothetical protein
MTQEQAAELLKLLYDIKTGLVILVGIASFRLVNAAIKGDIK